MAIVKRSLTIAGHRTSVSLEEPFWAAFQAIAEARGQSVNALAREIDAGRPADGGAPAYNLSSAIRLFVLAEAQGRGA